MKPSNVERLYSMEVPGTFTQQSCFETHFFQEHGSTKWNCLAQFGKAYRHTTSVCYLCNRLDYFTGYEWYLAFSTTANSSSPWKSPTDYTATSTTRTLTVALGPADGMSVLKKKSETNRPSLAQLRRGPSLLLRITIVTSNADNEVDEDIAPESKSAKGNGKEPAQPSAFTNSSLQLVILKGTADGEPLLSAHISTFDHRPPTPAQAGQEATKYQIINGDTGKVMYSDPTS
ncbi:hypothetical protein HOY80DRAFT_1031046 [Tuber brumale]|nr:hypothetical protein HOY80DRAFT_1031046 [Tuber brumale]